MGNNQWSTDRGLGNVVDHVTREAPEWPSGFAFLLACLPHSLSSGTDT